MIDLLDNAEIGSIGEQVACEFLVKRGFTIVSRNQRNRYGEVDIVCRKDGRHHFVEVKSTASTGTISRETSFFRPEEHVTREKLSNMERSALAYLSENGIDEDFQIDLVAVVLNPETKTAQVRYIENANTT